MRSIYDMRRSSLWPAFKRSHCEQCQHPVGHVVEVKVLVEPLAFTLSWVIIVAFHVTTAEHNITSCSNISTRHYPEFIAPLHCDAGNKFVSSFVRLSVTIYSNEGQLNVAKNIIAVLYCRTTPITLVFWELHTVMTLNIDEYEKNFRH